MVPGGSDPPPQNYGTWCPGGVRPTPPESRNGGIVTYRPLQRNETQGFEPTQRPHAGAPRGHTAAIQIWFSS
jgi:hypothetical protein